MKLTMEHARSLSRHLADIAAEITKYRFDNWDSLSKGRRDELEATEHRLITLSQLVTTLGVGALIDEARQSLEGLQDATEKAKDAIMTLKDVKGAIKIATAAMELAGAIISKSPEAIAKCGLNLAKLTGVTK